MDASPNPIAAAASMIVARRTAAPSPTRASTATVDHGRLSPILEAIRQSGIAALPGFRNDLADYIASLEAVDPDTLGPTEALAFWHNLYHAGALIATAESRASGHDSILRTPRVFDRAYTRVGGESLTLSDVENGKVRRFGDPRIHAALVCGSVSCPTLRFEPFTGQALEAQLDDQMRRFVSLGGVSIDRSNHTVTLNRIFLWYGGDFVRPDRMPSLAPAPKRRLVNTVAWWLSPEDRNHVWTTNPDVEFAPYDWSLACTVA